jgi:uncharacterized protein YqeY
MSTLPPDDGVDVIKARLRTDLRAAMGARRIDEVAVLRTLLGALDNAEAVSVAPQHYTERPFGDPATEVPRKRLSADDVEAVLGAEQRERLLTAETLERAGRAEDATKLRNEAAIVGRYLAKT